MHLTSRVTHFNKSVDMTNMMSRSDVKKAREIDNLNIKLRRRGFEPITGKHTLADYSDKVTEAKMKIVTGVQKLDKGSYSIDKTSARGDYRSIYTEKDPQLNRWLSGYPNQLESIDLQNPSEQYMKQTRKQMKDQLKFEYNKSISQIEDEFENNK